MMMIMIIIIVIITGTFSKSFKKYKNNIPGNHELQKLHETATLGTAHILRKVKGKVIRLQGHCSPEGG